MTWGWWDVVGVFSPMTRVTPLTDAGAGWIGGGDSEECRVSGDDAMSTTKSAGSCLVVGDLAGVEMSSLLEG